MVRLYLMPIAEAEKLPDGYFQKYFPQRFERSHRFRQRKDALRSLAAAALLHRVLGLEEKLLRIDGQGKPFSPHTNLQFNLSHSGDYALLAAADCAVGADIEKHDAAHLSIAERIYRPEELAWMRQKPESRFFALWTMKESVIKALGCGLSMPPDGFSVLPFTEGRPIELNGRKLYCHGSTVDGHSIAVCAETDFQLKQITMCRTD